MVRAVSGAGKNADIRAEKTRFQRKNESPA
jgi:hypothetical protein